MIKREKKRCECKRGVSVKEERRLVQIVSACLCVCVCVRERESERGRKRGVSVLGERLERESVCVFVCVCERESKK